MLSHRVGGFVMLKYASIMNSRILILNALPLPLTNFSFYYCRRYLHIYMHEYLADRSFPYGECIECKKRTAHFCIRCLYCYSCHSKVERLEKEKDVRVTRHGYYQILRQSPFLVYKRTRTS